jgi:hypothetical protein
MTISTTDEKEYVRKYLTALQGLMGFSPRELEIATQMVYRYRILLRTKAKLKGKKARDAFDPMKMLKSKEVLADITKELGMSFPVFKNYVSGLKHKGFFDGGKISNICIPAEGKTVIEFVHEQ